MEIHSALSAARGAPPLDVCDPEACILTADRPGLSTDGVSVEIHDNTMILRGERTHEVGMSCWSIRR